MKKRATAEAFWSVWIFNEALGDGHWEPYDEGMTTKGAAVKTMREEQRRWPQEKFSIVRTVNRRCPTHPKIK